MYAIRSYYEHPGDVLKKGDEVRARISNIDVENQRVSLSIKEFIPNEWDSFVEEHAVRDRGLPRFTDTHHPGTLELARNNFV